MSSCCFCFWLLQGWLAVKILCRSSLLVVDSQAGLSVKSFSVHAVPTPPPPPNLVCCFLLTRGVFESSLEMSPNPNDLVSLPKEFVDFCFVTFLWTRCSKVLSYFLLYLFVSAYCDGDIFLPSTGGTFQTPLYPGQYPADLRCIWKIEAAENDKIILRFRWEMSTFYSGDIEKLISATLSCTSYGFLQGVYETRASKWWF